MENRQAFLVKKQTMELRTVATPTPGPGEALVQVEYVGICGSDVHFFESGEFQGPLPFPIGLGHECAGVVAEVGPGVEHLRPGDRVALEPGVTCGRCKYCLEGKYNICPHVDFLAAPPYYKGALVNYMVHPAHLCFPLPPGVSTMEGALVEPLSVGFHAAMRSGAGFGKTVVIIGSGCIGLTTLLACKYMGTPNIVVADMFDNRLEMAKRLGADRVVNTGEGDPVERILAALDGNLADIVYECAGNPVTAAMTEQLVDRGGKIVMVGNVNGKTSFDFLALNNKEADVLSVFRYRNLYPGVIDALATGKVAVTPMVTKLYEFADVQQAMMDAVTEKRSTVKNVVKL